MKTQDKDKALCAHPVLGALRRFRTQRLPHLRNSITGYSAIDEVRPRLLIDTGDVVLDFDLEAEDLDFQILEGLTANFYTVELSIWHESFGLSLDDYKGILDELSEAFEDLDSYTCASISLEITSCHITHRIPLLFRKEEKEQLQRVLLEGGLNA